MHKIVNFSSKEYEKLYTNQKIIPTVRSVKYMKDHGIKYGDIITISVKGAYYCKAILIGYTDIKINEIPLEFLKYDTKIKNLDNRINNYQDFSDLLDSLLSPAKKAFAPNHPTTKKRILFFFRI